MNLKFSSFTNLAPGFFYTTKYVFRIKKRKCPLMNLSVRQIPPKCLAMDFHHVSHSDNFHNILCNPPPSPGQIFFFLPFLSPSAPVCFYSCKMLVALLKYCSALSALFFLPSNTPPTLFPSPPYPTTPFKLLLLLLKAALWGGVDG